MILTYMGLIIATVLLGGCGVSYRSSMKRLEAQKSSLDYLVNMADEEKRIREEEEEHRKREEELQKNRIFQLDFKVIHGSAFGGSSAIAPDGRYRRGTVLLDQIKMYGKNPAGQDITYAIDGQGIAILARDDAESLTVRSSGDAFEIREATVGRDEGVSVKEAIIRKNILYYLVLGSKHEIAILASEPC